MKRLFSFAWKVQEILSAGAGLPVALLTKLLSLFWGPPPGRRRETTTRRHP
jgi:hypothetical protein